MAGCPDPRACNYVEDHGEGCWGDGSTTCCRYLCLSDEDCRLSSIEDYRVL